MRRERTATPERWHQRDFSRKIDTMSPKKLIIAIVMNFFVMPGSGHLFLKQKKMGFALAAVACLILVTFVVHLNIMFQSNVPANPANGFDLPEVYRVITDLTTTVFDQYARIIKIYMSLIFLCYLAGFVDLVILYATNRRSAPSQNM